MARLQGIANNAFFWGALIVAIGMLGLIYSDGFATVDGAIRRWIQVLPFCDGVRDGRWSDPMYADDFCGPMFWWAVLVGLAAGVVIMAIAIAGALSVRAQPDVKAELAKVEADWSKPEFSGIRGRLRWWLSRRVD